MPSRHCQAAVAVPTEVETTEEASTTVAATTAEVETTEEIEAAATTTDTERASETPAAMDASALAARLATRLEEKDAALEENKAALEEKDAALEEQGATLAEERAAFSSLEESLLCVMCLDEKKTVLALPCAHLALCAPCAALLLKRAEPECPMCRGPLKKVLTVYG